VRFITSRVAGSRVDMCQTQRRTFTFGGDPSLAQFATPLVRTLVLLKGRIDSKARVIPVSKSRKSSLIEHSVCRGSEGEVGTVSREEGRTLWPWPVRVARGVQQVDSPVEGTRRVVYGRFTWT